MTLTEDFLTQAASDVLGPSREIVAAGVFGVEATYLGKAAGAVVGSLPGELLGGAAGEIVGVGAAVVGMHAADDAEAQKEGVTALVLLALTSESINILDWSKEDATARVLVTLSGAQIKFRHAATASYSWISPPRTSTRQTSGTTDEISRSFVPSGVWRSSPWWGLARL